MNSSQLAENTLWMMGPVWLSLREEESKSIVITEHLPEECLTEITVKNRGNLKSSTLLVNTNDCSISCVIEISRFSNLQRLLCVTAYVLRSLKNLKARLLPDNEHLLIGSAIGAKDIEEAEQYWILHVQTFSQQNKKFESWRREFDLFTDRVGILRCGGRLSHGDLPFSAKHLIVLDANHGFTTLVIRNCHESVIHDGVKETLTKLRSKFWLARGRQVVKKLLYSCVTCRRHEGKPYQAPPPPPLPEFRVKTALAFTFTALDYAGPLYVKVPIRRQKKRCGFACIPAVLQGQFTLT